jgi:hypothetical protein
MATQTLEKHRNSAKGTGWDLGQTNRTGKTTGYSMAVDKWNWKNTRL